MKSFLKKSFLFSMLFVVGWQFTLSLPNGLFADEVFAQLTNPLPTNAAENGVVDLYALESLFANILAIAASFAGLTAFIMLLVGGFKWLTSGGDPKKLESAKSSITYAVVGLFGLVLIWLILKFIQMFTGSSVDITIFKLPRW